MGTKEARPGLTLLVLAFFPLLMAVIVNIPADAGTLPVAVVPAPIVQVTPAQPDGLDYEVIIDTGVEFVGFGSSISALAIVATPDTEATQGLAQLDVLGAASGD